MHTVRYECEECVGFSSLILGLLLKGLHIR